MSDPLAHSAPGRTIRRGQGVTPAERYVKQLCDGTFLSLWSYPGLYRDQKLNGSSEGKELADLIVVFDDQILIFSDKHCLFPNTGDLSLDWQRWFRRAVRQSLKQLLGAERWLRNYPNRVFLDSRCTQPFPIAFPDVRTARFHLLLVAHDISPHCMRYLGGSGSLMIRSDLRGAAEHVEPFLIGDLNPAGTYVHVLDDTSLDILLKSLDTIADLTEYLSKKESFLRSSREVSAAGEEELLGVYLKSVNSAEEHDSVYPSELAGIVLDEGHWAAFQKHPQRLAQIEANRISYVWDELIERFSRHAMDGTQYFTPTSGVSDTEKILRFMASESRTRRRMLAKALIQLVQSTPGDFHAKRVLLPMTPRDPYYIFLFFPKLPGKSEQEYRIVRRNFLEACCLVLRLRFPTATDIVGIATESGSSIMERSEDAMYFDARNWTTSQEAEAKRLQEELQIFTDTKHSMMHEQEYPSVDTGPRP